MANKKFTSVVKFESCDAAKKLVATMEDYAHHYLNERFGTNYQVVQELGLAEKAQKINEKYVEELGRRTNQPFNAFDGEARDYAKFTNVAEMGVYLNKVMLDVVTPIVIDASGLSMLAEIHYGGYGDVFEFEMTDRYPYNVSKMGRRQKHTKTQTKKRNNKTITTDFYGLTTISNLPEILMGDAYIAEDIMLMALGINKKIYSLVVNAFVTGANAITDSRFVVTNYTETALLEKLRAGSAYNGAPMVVVGDAVALKSILPDNTNTRIFLQDEFNTTLGHMSTFNTYKVLSFDVVADEDATDGVAGLPTDRVYGISLGKGGKLIHVAIGATDVNTDDIYENSDLSVATTMRKELGVELATNQKVVKCTI